MNRVTDKKQAVMTVLWIVIIGVILSLWPLRLINETVVSDTNKQMVAESELPSTTGSRI